MEMFSLGKSEKIFQIKKFLQYNCLFFRIICSELLRTFTKETFLFEIFFHFSPIKTFPFGLILMGHISVFQVNDSKSMNFFYNFNIFRISCGPLLKKIIHFEGKNNCSNLFTSFLVTNWITILVQFDQSVRNNWNPLKHKSNCSNLVLCIYHSYSSFCTSIHFSNMWYLLEKYFLEFVIFFKSIL